MHNHSPPKVVAEKKGEKPLEVKVSLPEPIIDNEEDHF
jgi:hypothetical protein